MFMRPIITVLAFGLATLPSLAEAQDELTLIVNRDDDSATYYLSMPADLIAPVLASDPTILFSDNGRVPIEEFRRVGSFDLADDMFDNIQGSQGGDRFAFEAMSMMVHPTDTPLPFAAPWDAYTAIAVCTVQYEPDKLVPGKLQTYYGGFTDQISGDAPLSLHFPQTGRDRLEIVVHRYHEGRLLGTDVQVLDDGGSLVIETESADAGWMRSVGSWLGLL
ncbi:MAG: hypothetical protein AAF641_10560 [Pseudomonadota bacterium]